MGKNKKRKLARQLARPHAKQPLKNSAMTSPGKKKAARTAPAPGTGQASSLPFSPTDRILLVGEGDFSFAHSLVAHHECTRVVATSLDSQAEVMAKYHPQAGAHLDALAAAGQRVVHGVDARQLDQAKGVRRGGSGGSATDAPDDDGIRGGPPFDVIAFNFPHVGGKSTDVNRQVRFNQELLVAFFAAAQRVLAAGNRHAAIFVTLFDGDPYSLWNIRDLARHTGLEVRRSLRFDFTLYPGYRHARTLGNLEGGGAWRAEDRDARTYVFGRKGGASLQSEDGGRKRTRRRGESSDDDDDER